MSLLDKQGMYSIKNVNMTSEIDSQDVDFANRKMFEHLLKLHFHCRNIFSGIWVVS